MTKGGAKRILVAILLVATGAVGGAGCGTTAGEPLNKIGEFFNVYVRADGADLDSMRIQDPRFCIEGLKLRNHHNATMIHSFIASQWVEIGTEEVGIDKLRMKLERLTDVWIRVSSTCNQSTPAQDPVAFEWTNGSGYQSHNVEGDALEFRFTVDDSALFDWDGEGDLMMTLVFDPLLAYLASSGDAWSIREAINQVGTAVIEPRTESTTR